MGMAKYFEDNMEIIEERCRNYNSSYSERNYNYGNNNYYTRRTDSYVNSTKTSYYVVIGGKRIAV